jgi:EAL domain-containing protein (putative c-di-GMP-specific phosphodiesterase class I)
VKPAVRRQIIVGFCVLLIIEPARYIVFQLSIAMGDLSMAFGPDLRWMGLQTPIGQASVLRIVAALVTLEQYGLDPGSLVLEWTESGVMTSPDAARRVMTELRSLGVSLAVDDFGTGHSSLAHLREFPIDLLKIAREFVAGLPHGHVDRGFVETIVRMGNALGLEVVAEGIESRAQAAAAAELGCHLGQGYWYGAPVGVFGVTQYLTAARLPTVLIRPYAGAA